MAANSKQSKLSEKGDECTFTWKVYASWDFGIANVETAHNKVSKITYSDYAACYLIWINIRVTLLQHI